MERVLMLRLESTGCAAEAVLNDVPLGRTQQQGGTLCLPVHEYTLSGDNRLELIAGPLPLTLGFEPKSPERQLSDGRRAASLRLLLPRAGGVASETQARTLAQLDWTSAGAEVIELPSRVSMTVGLPVRFPRWRWLDAPPIADVESVRSQVASFLQGIALSFARGDAEGLVVAAKLRLDELAVAYQRPLQDDLARFRAHVQQAHAEQPLRPILPTAQGLILRPCAQGRLLECLASDGRPALRTEPGAARQHLWPARVAMVDGRLYVLR